LFSTILGIAGAEVPEYAQGHDLIKWVREGCKEPLRKVIFSQAGNYHGHLKTTFPGGIPESGRHKGLVQGARSLEYSYVHDPDYGDEAYDLKADPFELSTLTKQPGSLPPEVEELKNETLLWQEKCRQLTDELGIVPGDRGFWEGIIL
jgi:arylsulfatase A-like enzyme